jgi:hypothetical protein
VVPFTALLPASILYFELFIEYSGDLRPFGDASLLVDFSQGLVLLNKTQLTAAVHAFL